MEVTINELNISENEVEATYSYDEIKDDITGEVKKQTKKIQLPGFRKGKVPMSVLKKMYGDALEHEASEKVANKKFWEIVKEKQLKPIGHPQLSELNFQPEQELKFKVKYDIVPELEVQGHTGQRIEIPDFKIKEEDVEKEIDYILRSNSTKEKVDVVGDDNNFIIKAELTRVTKEGEPYQDAKPETIDIDLSNENVQMEIKEKAKGKKAGEKFSFTFTDERQSESGEEKIKEEYIYETEIKEIDKIIIPELNEEIIKKASKDKCTTEEELREQIKKDMQTYYDQRMDELVKNKLIQLVVDNNEFTPPNSLVENVLEDLIKREEEEAKRQGYGKVDTHEASHRLRPMAEVEVKWYLLKNAIEEKENIEVNDDDLKALAEKDAEKTGLPVDKLMNYYKSSNYGERLKDQKLFDYLKENNTLEKVDPEKYSQKQSEEQNEK